MNQFLMKSGLFLYSYFNKSREKLVFQAASSGEKQRPT